MDKDIMLKGNVEITDVSTGRTKRYSLGDISYSSVKERKNKIYIRFHLEGGIMISVPFRKKPEFVKVKKIIKERLQNAKS